MRMYSAGRRLNLGFWCKGSHQQSSWNHHLFITFSSDFHRNQSSFITYSSLFSFIHHCTVFYIQKVSHHSSWFIIQSSFDSSFITWFISFSSSFHHHFISFHQNPTLQGNETTSSTRPQSLQLICSLCCSRVRTTNCGSNENFTKTDSKKSVLKIHTMFFVYVIRFLLVARITFVQL